MRGAEKDPPLARLWRWAEEIWSDGRSRPWAPAARDVAEEAIEPELLAQLVAVSRASPTLYTLGPSPKPNFVSDVTASGLWVETERSRDRAEGPQLVPPRMLNLAWDVLRARGSLSNRELLDDKRVHRSSFVLAILARLPGVSVQAQRPLALRYTPAMPPLPR